jgi:hypothetical protein
MSYQIYRQSKVGDCLVEALDEMVSNDKIPGELATKILAEVTQRPPNPSDAQVWRECFTLEGGLIGLSWVCLPFLVCRY